MVLTRAFLLAVTAVLALAGCGDGSEPAPADLPATTAAQTVTPSDPTAPAAVSTSAPTTTTSSTNPPATTVTSTTLTAVTVTSAPPTTSAGPVRIDVTVANGAVKGPERVKVSMGDLIILTVTADVADEVHLHGYDLFADVAPGLPAVIEVEALIPGVFEVELEGARLELVLIEVK